jgi:hypothetical protein
MSMAYRMSFGRGKCKHQSHEQSRMSKIGSTEDTTPYFKAIQEGLDVLNSRPRVQYETLKMCVEIF